MVFLTVTDGSYAGGGSRAEKSFSQSILDFEKSQVDMGEKKHTEMFNLASFLHSFSLCVLSSDLSHHVPSSSVLISGSPQTT